MATFYSFFKQNGNRFYFIVISLLLGMSIVGGATFFRYYHSQFASAYVESFRLQNINLIEANDSLELGHKLESTKNTGIIQCAIGSNANGVFYQTKEASCASGLFIINKSLQGLGENNLTISFYISMPWQLELAFGLFLVLNFSVFALVLRLVRLFEVQQRDGQLRLSKLAQQVAHDIRSPLSALSTVTGSLEHLPEEKRLLIRNATQRITDIANDLLSKSKQSQDPVAIKTNPHAENLQLTPHLLSPIVESLVSEKRLQFHSLANIEIEANTRNSFASFANIHASELRRVLSNLINNAVESFGTKSGRVTVSLEKSEKDNFVVISVKDNGKGIPPHIVKKLGSTQLSYGKKESPDSGNGLGVYHAKKVTESFGGEFKITSTVGSGTVISLNIPLCKTPAWFPELIDLSNKDRVVTLDDDITIHQIWSARLKTLSTPISQLSFQSGDEFERAISNNINNIKNDFYFIDYELLGQTKTGLDLIENLGLEKHAILVTSRYEEPDIQSRAAQIGLKVLPKSLAEFIPINPPRLQLSGSDVFDAILIDDDPLVKMTWELAAKIAGKTIKTFVSGQDFLSSANVISAKNSIYIDSNLSDNERGEVLAEKLYEMGFTDLYLATGMSSDDFKDMKYIKAIVGKDAPF